MFREEGYEVILPIEYNAMKTVVVKSIDYMVDSYTDQEVTESIEDLNEGLKVEDIYRIPTTSKTQTALTKGLVVLHQFIPANKIEKEIFIKLTPCRNCFGYEHKEKDCPNEKKMSAKQRIQRASIVEGSTALWLPHVRLGRTLLKNKVRRSETVAAHAAEQELA